MKCVILVLGINDIVCSEFPFTPPTEKVKADDIVAGYRQLKRAHGKGIGVIAATNPRFENSALRAIKRFLYLREGRGPSEG